MAAGRPESVGRTVITAVIPVSPVKQHPETSILEEVVASVRHHLPTAEIILTFDGVRPEQENRRQDYELAIQRILWLAKSWGPVYPWVFDQHLHQTGMLRRVLDDVRTPLLLYCEADTPLVTDEPIDWDTIIAFMEHGHSNLVRFSHEALVLDAHKHLMLNTDLCFTETAQWSQRPHVATTAYYRRLLDSYFTLDSKAFLEDRLHGVIQEAYKLDGRNGWLQHRLHLYTPPGDNIKRSYHLDGRQGEPKWDDSQVF